MLGVQSAKIADFRDWRPLQRRLIATGADCRSVALSLSLSLYSPVLSLLVLAPRSPRLPGCGSRLWESLNGPTARCDAGRLNGLRSGETSRRTWCLKMLNGRRDSQGRRGIRKPIPSPVVVEQSRRLSRLCCLCSVNCASLAPLAGRGWSGRDPQNAGQAVEFPHLIRCAGAFVHLTQHGPITRWGVHFCRPQGTGSSERGPPIGRSLCWGDTDKLGGSFPAVRVNSSSPALTSSEGGEQTPSFSG